jgi:hypothetical protein
MLLQTLYSALCLPDAVDYAVDALAETVLTPRITDFELEDVKVNGFCNGFRNGSQSCMSALHSKQRARFLCGLCTPLHVSGSCKCSRLCTTTAGTTAAATASAHYNQPVPLTATDADTAATIVDTAAYHKH